MLDSLGRPGIVGSRSFLRLVRPALLQITHELFFLFPRVACPASAHSSDPSPHPQSCRHAEKKNHLLLELRDTDFHNPLLQNRKRCTSTPAMPDDAVFAVSSSVLTYFPRSVRPSVLSHPPAFTPLPALPLRRCSRPNVAAALLLLPLRCCFRSTS